MNNETLGIIIGFLSVLITQYLQYKKSSLAEKELKSLVTEKDLKQDAKLDTMFTAIEEWRTVKRLKNKIRKEIAKIIRFSHLHNTELVSLLNNVKDKYMSFLDSIVDTDIKDLNVTDIECEVRALAKNIQNGTKWNNIDVLAEKDFYKELKTQVVIPNLQIFTMRIKDEIIDNAKKYNGTFSKIALGVITNIISESIRVYGDCKRND